MYTQELLLQKLKQKYDSLGRTPTIQDIINDKDMPSFSTYQYRFGGVTNALEMLNITPNKMFNISWEKAVELAQNYYARTGRVPTVTDFNNEPNYPSSSFIKDTFELSWNEFLTKADLPIYTNGKTWAINRRAETMIKTKLIQQGHIVEDLSEKNTNAPHSFIINNKFKVDVRSSATTKERNNLYWKFKLHLHIKKHAPDFFICVGFNETVPTIFTIPTETVKGLQCLSINSSNIGSSKYCKYRTDIFQFEK